VELLETVRIGEATVDLVEGRIELPGGVRTLSPIEVRLISFLASRRGTTLSREVLLAEVWGYAPQVESRAVDHAIVRLRRKLEPDPARPQWITSRRGGGYRLEPQQVRPSTTLEVSSSFIGRGHELARITDTLAQHRVVALVGLGGMGKTRLALQIARSWQDRGGEVVLIGLGGASSARDALGRVAATLGVEPARVVDALEGRPEALCVLDEIEGLEDADLAWLRSAQAPRFLLTSLRPSGLASATVEIGSLSLDDAAALLIERAPVPLARQDADLLADALQGVPFALELAARWLAVATPADVLHRLDVLRGGATGRHESVGAALAGSWDLLSAQARSTLGLAAQFTGAFSISDLEGLVGGEVLPIAVELQARGWLYRSGSKLAMYTVIRHFLRQQGALPEDGVERLGAWLLSWAPRAHRSQNARWDAQLHERLESADADLRRVVSQVRDPDVTMPLLAVLSSRIGGATLAELEQVAPQVGPRSPWAADLHLLRGVALTGSGDLPAARQAMEEARRALPFNHGRDRGLGGSIDQLLASVLMDLGDTATATALLQQAIAAMTEIGDGPRAGRARATLGMLVVRSDVDAGIALMLDALRDLAPVGNPVSIGIIHTNIGAYSRDPARRRDHTQRGEALLRSVGATRWLASVLINRAIQLMDTDEVDEARALVEEAREIARTLGRREDMWRATLLLSGLHLYQGSYAESLDLAFSAQAGLRQIGALSSLAIADTVVALAELALGRPDRAIRGFEAAMEGKSRTSAGGGTDRRAQAGLALARLAHGQLEEARALLPQLGEAYQRIVEPLFDGEPVPPADPGAPADVRLITRLARLIEARLTAHPASST
jgi:DNA-binding winged helix-turn-helix (wHTH) protein/tetratricopeptide (TPR) repeat protein